jgi:hypothetical protein
MPAPLFPIQPVTPNDEPEFLTHNTKHIGQAFARLLTQFQDKQRLKKVIEILLRPLQEAEDMFWSLYEDRRLDNAEGAQLDILGRIILERRDGLSDTDFRAIIRVKVRVLRSNGSAADLMAITDLMLQGLTPYDFRELFPGAIEVELKDNTLFDSKLLLRFLRLAKAAGVRIDVIQPSSFPAGTFRYGDLPEITNVLTGYDDGFYANAIP